MPINVKTLAAVNDEVRLNSSEALSGTVLFNLNAGTGTWTVVFEAKPIGAPDAAFTAIQVAKLADGTLVTSTTNAAPGNFRVDASGQLVVRARMSVSGPGTTDVYGGVSLG